MDEATVDKITEAVAKILTLPPGSRREQNLNELIKLIDEERVRVGEAYMNSVRAHALVIEENRELRAEVQRLQSAEAVRMTA